MLLVTLGVILTTLSASPTATASLSSSVSAIDPYTYVQGIGILTLALLLSGFLGLVQDHTYSKYGRPTLGGSGPKTSKDGTKIENTGSSPAWQESMFYLHFLALPMFLFLRNDLSAQLSAVNSGPRTSLSMSQFTSFLNLPQNSTATPAKTDSAFQIPIAYFPLLLNTFTQLLCIAGVHRLTTRVSSLSVTLVLVVRKAVSLVLSVVGIGMMGRTRTEVDKGMMWSGAGLVLLGTIGYSIGTRSRGGGAAGKVEGEDKRKRE